MSNRPWIKLIAPAYRYRSGNRGNQWVNIKDKCYHRSKNPVLAAREMMITRRRLKLVIDGREYGLLPYRGVGFGSTYALVHLESVITHIRHCVELHKAFYDE